MKSKILMFIFTITFMSCITYLGVYYLKTVQGEKAYAQLADMVASEDELMATMTPSPTPEMTIAPVVSVISGAAITTNATPTAFPTPYVEPEVLDKYKELYEMNSDLAGWMKIDGTIIDYPVVLKDNEFYLRRNFYKEDATAGCLFIDEKCSIIPERTTNVMIYGHNMRAGTMFADLHKYKEKSFYEENKYIQFDTIYETATYQIVSVFLSQVFNSNDQVFKFYKFVNAETEQEYYDFAYNIKSLQMYDTGVEINYGDDLLTLITCSPHLEEKKGRLVVVAKRIR